jgi:hypothetical protein
VSRQQDETPRAANDDRADEADDETGRKAGEKRCETDQFHGQLPACLRTGAKLGRAAPQAFTLVRSEWKKVTWPVPAPCAEAADPKAQAAAVQRSGEILMAGSSTEESGFFPTQKADVGGSQAND